MPLRLVPPLAGFRPPLVPDPFERLVGAIAAQPVSLSGANATATGSSSATASTPASRGRSRRASGWPTRASWALARRLARPTARPWGDLVLRRAVESHYRGLDVRAAGARVHPFQNPTAHDLPPSHRVP